MNKNNINQVQVLRLSDLYHREENVKLFEHHGCMYFTRGKGDLVLDFKSYKYDKGTWLTFSKGQLLRTRFDSDAEGFVILFTENFIDVGVLRDFKRKENLNLSDKETSEENIYGFILNLYKEYKSSEKLSNDQLLKRQLEIILLKINRCLGTKPVSYSELYLSTFLQFEHMVRHKHKKTRNALDYADDLEITYKHLNTICKEVSGRTAKDVINDYLIVSIKRELVLTEKPIKTLTTEFGFDEPTNFVKYFKRYSGDTPKGFRKK